MNRMTIVGCFIFLFSSLIIACGQPTQEGQMACTDMCIPGTTQCQGDGVLSCQDVNEDGCLEWGNWIACPGSQICIDGSCRPSGQNDECVQVGQRRCNGSGYQICGDLDDDGQLEWGQVIDCQPGLTCENGDCVELPPEQTCTNDDFEPNDSSDKATPVDPGEIRGLKICERDQDWFSIGLGAGDSLEAAVVFDPAAGQLDLSLLDANGARLAFGALSGDTLRLQAQIGEPGSYFLVIAGRGEIASAYRLRVIKREAEVDECSDDDFEDNDSIQDPTEVIAGLGTGLTICGTDEDWYAIELQAGDTLRVEIQFPHRNGDLDLWLYGVHNNLIGSSSSQSDSEVLQAVASQAGFYKIQVKGNGVVENSYSLQLEVTTEQTCPTDAFESNDSWQQATGIDAGQFQNLTLCEGDQDWYSVHLDEGDTLIAELLFAHRDGNLDAIVFDPFSNQVASGNSTNDSEYINVRADSTGQYTLQVFSQDQGWCNYSLHVTVEASDVCSNDRYESNNNFLTAYPLEVYAQVQNQFSNLSLCEDDKDWFKIYMYAGETLIIDLRFSHARGDLDLYLFSDWLELLGWSTSYSDNERIHLQVPWEGIYYIRVSGDGSPNNYELDIGIY